MHAWSGNPLARYARDGGWRSLEAAKNGILMVGNSICSICEKDLGPFAGCRLLPGYKRCANCLFNEKGCDAVDRSLRDGAEEDEEY